MTDYSNNATVLYWNVWDSLDNDFNLLMKEALEQDSDPWFIAEVYDKYVQILNSWPTVNIDADVVSLVRDIIVLYQNVAQFFRDAAVFYQQKNEYENRNFNIGFNFGYNVTSPDSKKGFWENLLGSALEFGGNVLINGVPLQRAEENLHAKGAQIKEQCDIFWNKKAALRNRLQQRYGIKYIQ